MERIDELFKKLNSTNKRLDAANKKLAEAEADKQKLWSALHRTNKNGDLLKVAIDSLSESTGSKIDLDKYEIQLVKRR